MRYVKVRLKAQTSTEYLVILAIVIVIAVLVVGVLGGVPSLGGGVNENTARANLASQTISITNYAVSDYDTSLVLRNSVANRIIIETISLNGERCTFFYGVEHKFKPGESKTITCQNVYELSDSRINWEVEINWTDLVTGVTYTQNDQDAKLVGSVASKYLSQIDNHASYSFASKGCYNTSLDPIPICTCSDLNNTRANLNSNHSLQNSIDFERCKDVFGVDYTPTGTAWVPIAQSSGRYNALFNGSGFVIKNLYVNTGTTSAGLFGVATYNNATFANLGLVEVNITSTDSTGLVGGIVGVGYGSSSFSGASITNSYATGTINATNAEVGGLSGWSSYMNIYNSYTRATVIGGGAVGGLTGQGTNQNITNSFSESTVIGGAYVGGLSGYAGGSRISNSYANGTVTCTGSSDFHCGGLVGLNGAAITFTGTVTWTNYSQGDPASCIGTASSKTGGTNPAGCSAVSP